MTKAELLLSHWQDAALLPARLDDVPQTRSSRQVTPPRAERLQEKKARKAARSRLRSPQRAEHSPPSSEIKKPT